MSTRAFPLLPLLLAGVLLAVLLGRRGHEPAPLLPEADRRPAASSTSAASTPESTAGGPVAVWRTAPAPGPSHPQASVAPPAWLARALEQLEDDADPLKLEARLAALLARIAREHSPAVLDQLSRHPGPAAAALGERLVRRWAADAPAEAARWVLEQPGTPRADWLVQAALGWAEADLPAARDWAAGLADAPGLREARLAVAHELARREPVPALDLAAALLPGPDRDQFLAHGVAQWAAADPAAAASWVAQLPSGPLRNELQVRALVAGAGGPEPALGTLDDLAPGPQRDAAIVQLAQRHVQADPAGTLEWLAGLPEAALRHRAAGPALDIWLHLDPPGMEHWLRAAPPGDLRDLALGRLARVTGRTNASDAVTWAALIADPALRAETLTRLPAAP